MTFTLRSLTLGAVLLIPLAVTAAADVSVGTQGANAGASVTPEDAKAAADFSNGMAVFTIAMGGLMYNATAAGQKFSYRPRTDH